MADDIIDNSETRRGKQCWYLVDKIGDLAINDAFLLTGVLYYLLDRYLFNKPYYTEIVGLFHDVYLKTSMGQCMDIQSSKEQNIEE
jgi:farnesyl diphosphate synthase